MARHLAHPAPVYPTLSRCLEVMAIDLGAFSTSSIASAGRMRGAGAGSNSTCTSGFSSPEGFHGTPFTPSTFSLLHLFALTGLTARDFTTLPSMVAMICSSVAYRFPSHVPGIHLASMRPPCGLPGILCRT